MRRTSIGHGGMTARNIDYRSTLESKIGVLGIDKHRFRTE
jgi:hypothetical protein